MKFRITILMFIIVSFALTAGTVEQTLNFNTPKIANQDGFDKIFSDDLSILTRPGMPELPSKPVQILIPAGEKAVSVSVAYSSREIIASDLNLYPVQKPYPMSYTGDTPFVTQNAEVYSKNEFYPAELYSDLNTQYLRGHSIALLNVFPMQYNPVSGDLAFYSEITVSVQTSVSAESQNAFQKFYRDDIQTSTRLEKLVMNTEAISSYPSMDNSRDVNDFEYIIVTNSNYLAEMDDFINFKAGQGYHVLAKTTEEIYAEYPGTDIADQIRNFIIDAYQNMGAEFVLLAGDIGIVPHRGFWVDAGGTEDFNMPSDLYYEGLDRVGTGSGPDWNVNSNGQWAETSEADYYAEVHVGRISADNTTELLAAINKQIMYQDSPVIDDLENTLMVGEELNNSPYTYGGDYKDEVVAGGNYNGLTTAGFDANLSVETLYERDGGWSVQSLQNQMSNGINFINHLGHSNTDYNMKFYNNTVNNNTIQNDGINHNFFIIYSQGCLPAAIETNCIAEKFTTIDNGCVVYVGNTRYGWYMPGGTNSSSQEMDRQFWDALFGEGITQVSAMNNDSKEDGASQCNDPWFRWAYYELIVLGDPSLDVWTAVPTDITALYQPSISIGTYVIPFQTDAPFARVGLFQNDELIGRAVADGNGDVLLETFEPIITPETISVSIIGHNKTRHLGEIYVISDEPYVIFESYEVNDANGNGNNLPDFSEEISLDFTLQNVGNQPAANVAATISSTDEYISITTDTASFGTINSQNNSVVTDAYAMTIADDIPDQHEIIFDVETTDNTDETWMSYFTMTACAPDFLAGSMLVNDSSGNNNGILDPGETATIIISVENIGHAISPLAVSSLVADNDLITFESTISQLGILGIQGSANATFNVTADASISLGTQVEFTFNVVAGSYNYFASFGHPIGLIVEDFETGDFTSYPWEFTGSADWEISAGAYEGDFCAKSGTLGNNANATLRIEVETSADGDLSFYRTVSSEANFDYLQFYIDGAMMDQWSGDVTWGQETYVITEGSHTFEWRYDKDQAVTGGTDNARVDFILFPPLGMIFPPIMNVNPGLLNVDIAINQTLEEIIEISNIGGEILDYTVSVTGSINWLTVTPDNGSLNGGEMEEITVTFDATGMEEGQYSSGLMFEDGLGGQTIVPVIMNVSGTDADNNLLPLQTELFGNHPNPFNPTTNIKYGLNVDSHVAINIYNIKGQKVRTLINEKQQAGYHNLTWNGYDDSNRKTTSGIYFYEMKTEETNYTSIKKMLLLK
jgi:Peptidase family C25/Propeptide_C25/FlgD Ig-like domain/Viral BACON domain/Peptidase family C25, C terminal ig-like domain